MAKPTPDQLRNRFLYQPPNEERKQKHSRITDLTLAAAQEITDLCNEGRQLSLALTALEEVRMRANASIAGVE